MKRIYVSALALLMAAGAVKAQTGSILVGGDVDYGAIKAPNSGFNTGDKETKFDFNPTMGYQFNNNWTAGAVALISIDKQTSGSSVNKTNGFAAGPFIRYAKPLSNMFAAYAQLQGLFGSDKHTFTTGGTGGTTITDKATLTDVRLFPALFINFKNNFGLNFNIGGIEYTSSKPKGSDATNAFAFTFGKEIGIGVSKNFGGKKK